jgi:hypothetical protein
MQLFGRFLKAISRMVPPGMVTAEDARRLSELNPHKFYIENVRSLLGVSTWQATQICETGVRQQVFDRCVEVQCPDGAIAAEADSEAELPQTVECYVEQDGHLEVEQVATDSLKKGTFYRLHADSNHHARSA